MLFRSSAFDKAVLAAAIKTISTYQSKAKVEGSQDDFKITTQTKTAIGNTESTIVVSIAVVPSGDTWLVDYINVK